MYYIGIDIAKESHCVSVINHLGEIKLKPFFFENNFNGFEKLFKSIKKFISEDCLVGMEATGHYGENLLNFLLSKNINVGVINPLSTDAERKKKIRKTKNDKIDTYIISKVLMSNDYTKATIEKQNSKKLRELTRYRSCEMEKINQIKNKLQKCIDIVFPEFNSLFKTKYTKTYMAILKEFKTAYNIANAHLTSIKTIVNASYRGKKLDFTAQELKEIAKKSIGLNDEIECMKITQFVAEIEFVSANIESIDKKIEEYANSIDSPIISVPGIGITTGMSILAEIGDINNFSSPAKLIAYAGIDPATYQSGDYNAPRTAISKRGSKYLRKAIYQCILTVVNYNPVFQEYYNLKRAQGKSHRCAQGHCARKLLRVLYRLLTENNIFDSESLR